jgi:hypothetical protein
MSLSIDPPEGQPEDISFEESEADTRALAVSLLLQSIYRKFGVEPIAEAAKLAWHTVMFAFLEKRLSRRPEKYQIAASFFTLICRFIVMGRGAERRYRATLVNPVDILNPLSAKRVGCMNFSSNCPGRISLQKLRMKETYLLTNGDKRFLDNFGRDLKLCERSVQSFATVPL